MRTLPVLTALVAIASLSCAFAQSDSVIVNPMEGRMLIDPATGKERFVPDLLQPWQTEALTLRPPRKHRRALPSSQAAVPQTPASAPSDSFASAPEAAPPPRKHRQAPPSSQATAPQSPVSTPSDSFASAPEAAPPPRKAKPKRTASVAPPAPPQQSAPATGFSDFTDLISAQPSAPQPPRKKAAPPPRAPEPVVATPREPPRVEKPVQRASLEPPKPSKPRIVTGAKKDSIAFAPNASDPSTSAVGTIRTLAGTLSSALSDGNARVQLMAYAGMRGEKSSDTRRLSLKRALVIRQLLIDDGVPSERIDVFALGGVDDEGPLDRVDVFVKG